MFEKLRSAFANVSKSLGEKEIGQKDIDAVLSDLEISLLESDVAIDVVDSIKGDLQSRLVGTKVDKNTISTFIRDSLIRSISLLFDNAGSVDLFKNIDSFKEKNEPYIVLFVGINGTGKTTSLAKIARLLQKSKYSLVIAAADTFRAGAIEQLSEHAKRLNLKIIAQNYGSDPAAVCRDAVLYAKSHKTDCVLIDTAGRMQTSKNLMEQIEKINKVVKPHLTIFVGDSLAGNDTVNQAKEFHQHITLHGSILTKSDADARGGAALSIVQATNTPVMFVGTGQEYDDIRSFDKRLFLETVFGSVSDENLSPAGTAEPAEPAQAPESSKQEEPVPPAQHQPKPTPAEPAQVSEPPKQEEPVPPAQHQPKPTPAEPAKPAQSDDPFHGISNDDIARYTDLYDIAPPESDEDARKLAEKIKQWISDDRPEPHHEPENKPAGDSDGEKPKKKQGLFGFLKK